MQMRWRNSAARQRLCVCRHPIQQKIWTSVSWEYPWILVHPIGWDHVSDPGRYAANPPPSGRTIWQHESRPLTAVPLPISEISPSIPTALINPSESSKIVLIPSLHRAANHWDWGGDHTIVLPILRSAFKTHGPVGVIHVDAHSDINDTMFGEKIAHGTPFRRAYEEGLIEPSKVFQVGVRDIRQRILAGHGRKDSPLFRAKNAGINPWHR